MARLASTTAATALSLAVLLGSAAAGPLDSLEAIMQIKAPDGLPLATVTQTLAQLLGRDLTKDFTLVSVKKISSPEDTAANATVLQDLEHQGRGLQDAGLDFLFTEDGSMLPLSEEDMDVVLEQYAKLQAELQARVDLLRQKRAPQYDVQYGDSHLNQELGGQAAAATAAANDPLLRSAHANADDHAADRAIYEALGSSRQDITAALEPHNSRVHPNTDPPTDEVYADYLDEEYEFEAALGSDVKDDESASLSYQLWSHRLAGADSAAELTTLLAASGRQPPSEEVFVDDSYYEYSDYDLSGSQHYDDTIVWSSLSDTASKGSGSSRTADSQAQPGTDAFERERQAAGLNPILDTMTESEALPAAITPAADSGPPTARLNTYIITLKIQSPDAKALQTRLGNLISDETLAKELSAAGLTVAELAVFFADERVYAPVPQQAKKQSSMHISLRDVMAGIETRKQAMQILQASQQVQQDQPAAEAVSAHSMLGSVLPRISQRAQQLLLQHMHSVFSTGQHDDSTMLPEAAGRAEASGYQSWAELAASWASYQELWLTLCLLLCLAALMALCLMAKTSRPARRGYELLESDEEDPEKTITNPLIVVNARSWVERIERQVPAGSAV